MYQDYAKYFDKIFPASEQTIKFLETNLVGNQILDIGCGSGEMTNALHKLGYQITGMDLDSEMIHFAKEKHPNIEFEVANMLEMDTRIYNSMYCIGNTLVHLPTKNDIQLFVNSTYEKLDEEGTLVLQIINYDRILRENVSSLPTITNEGVVFERNYSPVRDKIRFSTKLSADGKVYEGYTDLIPLLKVELETILINAGFKEIKFFSGFSDKEFSIDAYALVVVAKKG